MELTTEQINQLKTKGLNDTDITSLASKYGYTMPSSPNFLQRVGRDLAQRSQKTVEAVKRIPSRAVEAGGVGPQLGITAPLATAEAAGKIAGQFAGGAGDILFEGIKSAANTISPDLGKKIAASADYILSAPNIRPSVEKLITLAQKYPDLAQDVGAVIDTLTLGGGAAAEKPVLGLTERVAGGVGRQLEKTGESLAKRGTQLELKEAVELTRPFNLEKDSNRAAKAYFQVAQKEGRVAQRGLGRGYEVLPSEFDNVVADSIKDITKSGDNIFNKQQLIRNEIGKISQDTEKVIKNYDSIFNKGEFRNYITRQADDNFHQFLFAGDANARRVYDSVVNTLTNLVEKNKLSGVLSARQDFDDIANKFIEKASKQNQIFGQYDDIKQQAVMDVRRAANDFVYDNVSKVNQQAARALKVNMEKSFFMHEAVRRMENNALNVLRESGIINKVEKFAKSHPLVSLGLIGGGGFATYQLKDIFSSPLSLLALLTGGSILLGGKLYTSQMFVKTLSKVLEKGGNTLTNIEKQGIEQMINTATKNYAKNPKLGLSVEDVSKNAYKGETDLTTKILKDLEGKTTVSKQYILDATNRGELKQVERDVIRQALEGEGDTINVSDFAKKVKAELLPLKLKKNYNANYPKTIGEGGYPIMSRTKFESISLPSELRGNVKNYDEHLWESPIKTSAGQTHFPNEGIDNYFGHTRIEDMADNKTRRVIEVQSDLHQRGRLQEEFGKIKKSLLESLETEMTDFTAKFPNIKKSEIMDYIENCL